MIAIEERCVDFDARNAATGNTQSDDDPIERLWVVAARFPAVVPCACVCEDTWFADGWGGRCEVICGGEPFVGEGEDARAERFRDEV